MTDLFYYAGFAYILFQTSGFYSCLYPDKEADGFINKLSKDVPRDITEAIDRSRLNNLVETNSRFLSQKRAGIVLGIFFFCWIVAGWFYSQEATAFGAIFYISVAFFLTPFVISIHSALNSDKFFLDAFVASIASQTKSKTSTVLNFAECSIKIILTSYILHSHFYIIA